MAVEEVQVEITPTGEVRITVAGVTGMACLTTTAELERRLGGAVVQREMTDEAYRSAGQEQTRQQDGWSGGSW